MLDNRQITNAVPGGSETRLPELPPVDMEKMRAKLEVGKALHKRLVAMGEQLEEVGIQLETERSIVSQIFFDPDNLSPISKSDFDERFSALEEQVGDFQIIFTALSRKVMANFPDLDTKTTKILDNQDPFTEPLEVDIQLTAAVAALSEGFSSVQTLPDNLEQVSQFSSKLLSIGAEVSASLLNESLSGIVDNKTFSSLVGKTSPALGVLNSIAVELAEGELPEDADTLSQENGDKLLKWVTEYGSQYVEEASRGTLAAHAAEGRLTLLVAKSLYNGWADQLRK